jgi:hypothetical protein
MQSPGEPVSVHFNVVLSSTISGTLRIRVWWNYYQLSTGTFIPYFDVDLSSVAANASSGHNINIEFVVPTVYDKIQLILATPGTAGASVNVTYRQARLV